MPSLLVACERSGVVRDAFLRRGWDAWSCDLADQEGTGPHIVGDALDALDTYEWDMLIAHPPCTYLATSGMHWTVRGLRDPRLTEEAIAFAEALWTADVPRICIENPQSVLSTRSILLGKPTQKIQPYQFGHDASKWTWLWLRGLPPLELTGPFVPPRIVERGEYTGSKRWSNQTDSGQNKLGPSKTRWMERSRTFPGIAEAMADQWG